MFTEVEHGMRASLIEHEDNYDTFMTLAAAEKIGESLLTTFTN